MVYLSSTVCMYNKIHVDIKVNGGRKSAIFELHQVDIFQGISPPETTHFVL